MYIPGSETTAANMVKVAGSGLGTHTDKSSLNFLACPLENVYSHTISANGYALGTVYHSNTQDG